MSQSIKVYMIQHKEKNNNNPWLPLLAALAPALLLFYAIWLKTSGHFTYTLDDPYIHLALAKNIFHGTYGINPHEAAAPSSSILWPWLLVPFATLPYFEYVPLAINLACLIALAYVVDGLFRDLKTSLRLLSTLAILFATNAYGLVFTGMEHSLHVLLSAVVARFLVGYQRQESPEISAIAALALVLLPLVRYEGLAISLPVLCYLFIKGRRIYTVLLLTAIILSLGSFSAYLYSHGLGYLPSSVLAKSTHGHVGAIIKNILVNILLYGFLLLPLFVLVLDTWPRDKYYAMMLLGITALHFTFGHHGWFGRYEVYYVLFILLLLLRQLADIDTTRLRYIPLLPVLFMPLVTPFFQTPLASSNILNQQATMAEIARRLGEPVAVNDLGLVSLRSGVYVLDLYGLGSIKALRQRLSPENREDARWMETLMQEKNVRYAMIYDNWFAAAPPGFIKIGEMRLMQKRITPAWDIVTFYALDEASAKKLKHVLETFAREHPSIGSKIVVMP